jgi:acyl dehydratase
MSSLADLPKGYAFPPVSFELTDDWVQAYVDAVEDAATGGIAPDLVPPMAVAALSVRAMLEQASLPPGTLHAGQELSFLSPVHRGETLTVSAQVASRGERAGWVLMGIELRVERGDQPVMTGRATISFPVQTEVAA